MEIADHRMCLKLHTAGVRDLADVVIYANVKKDCMNWLCHDNKSDSSPAVFLVLLEYHTKCGDCIKRNKLNQSVDKYTHITFCSRCNIQSEKDRNCSHKKLLKCGKTGFILRLFNDTVPRAEVKRLWWVVSNEIWKDRIVIIIWTCVGQAGGSNKKFN